MKTRTRKPSAAKSELPKPEPAPVSVENQEAEVSEKLNRMSFNLTPEGLPDFDGMRRKTREQLAAFLRNESVQKELGIAADETKKAEESGFDQNDANALLDLLGQIDALGASAIYKIPSEVTTQAFAFTEDHRKKINPPMIRLLNKWGPAIVKTWKDEIGFSLIMLSTLNSQVRLMHALETRRRRLLVQPPIVAAPPTPSKVTSISEPSAAREATPEAPQPEKPVEQAEDMLETVGFNA